MKKKYVYAYLGVRFTVTEEEYNSVANSEDNQSYCKAIKNIVRRNLECHDYKMDGSGYFPDASSSEDDEFWDTEPFDCYEF